MQWIWQLLFPLPFWLKTRSQTSSSTSIFKQLLVNCHVGMAFAICVSTSLVRDFCQTRVFGISIAMKAWRMHNRRDSSSAESSAEFVLSFSSLSIIASSCSLLFKTLLKQHDSSMLLKPNWLVVSCSCKSSFEYGFHTLSAWRTTLHLKIHHPVW